MKRVRTKTARTRKPDWVSFKGTVQMFHGDCVDVFNTMDATIDLVATSPPYAMQRKELYQGVPEKEYPQWTKSWFDACAPIMSKNASFLVNIREHVSNGEMSDYVHRTRMLLREQYVECDELIWVKPCALPTGGVRLRRSWERILWFSSNHRCFIDAKAIGKSTKHLNRVGSANTEVWGMKRGGKLKIDIAKSPDYVVCYMHQNEAGSHVAAFPVKLASWMVKGWCPKGGTVCDPFSGSGTTAIASIRAGRRFIGIELKDEYFEASVKRIERELKKGLIGERV